MRQKSWSIAVKKGLYPEQLVQWRLAFIHAENPGGKAALKQSQKEIKQLKKELLRKEKSLAEAAPILVLRKKLTDYYGETDGDD